MPTLNISSKLNHINQTTIKKQIFVNEVLKDGNVSRAYNVIHPDVIDTQTLYNSGAYLMKTQDVKDSIIQSLSNAGLTIEYLNKELKSLTKAEKAIILNDNIEYVPDNPVRIDSIKTAYRLYRVLDADNKINIDSKVINLDLDSASIDKLSQTVKELDRLNSKLQLSSQSGEVIDADITEDKLT